MALREELLALEEGFWRAAGDRDSYEARVAPDAVHVFPGWGVAGLDRVLAAVAEVPPWDEFELRDVQVVELDENAAAVVYTAHAVRGGEPYVAAMSTVYRRRGEGWQLVLHQQTPLPDAQ